MALRPAGKTLSSLTGILVMVAVLWFLLNFVYAPSCGRFGCSYEPAWWPQAKADNGDACPDSIDAAATDATWAADQLDTIAEEPQTAGLFYDPDGAVHEFDSSHDVDRSLARGGQGGGGNAEWRHHEGRASDQPHDRGV